MVVPDVAEYVAAVVARADASPMAEAWVSGPANITVHRDNMDMEWTVRVHDDGWVFEPVMSSLLPVDDIPYVTEYVAANPKVLPGFRVSVDREPAFAGRKIAAIPMADKWRAARSDLLSAASIERSRQSPLSLFRAELLRIPGAVETDDRDIRLGYTVIRVDIGGFRIIEHYTQSPHDAVVDVLLIRDAWVKAGGCPD